MPNPSKANTWNKSIDINEAIQTEKDDLNQRNEK